MAVAVCTLMGLWQLGVYGAKHEDVAQATRSTAPVDVLKVWGPDEPFTAHLVERPVWVRGAFTGDQFLVRRGEGRYWVVAPLRVHGTDSLLLIVRGRSDEQLASPARPVGPVRFRAVLQPGEDSSTKTIDPTSGIYDTVSIPQLANVFKGDDLFSGYALTDDVGINAGLRAVAPPDPDVAWTVGLRNLAYALQWWVFGLFSAFMWWRMATDVLDVESSVEASRLI